MSSSPAKGIRYNDDTLYLTDDVHSALMHTCKTINAYASKYLQTIDTTFVICIDSSIKQGDMNSFQLERRRFPCLPPPSACVHVSSRTVSGAFPPLSAPPFPSHLRRRKLRASAETLIATTHAPPNRPINSVSPLSSAFTREKGVCG